MFFFASCRDPVFLSSCSSTPPPQPPSIPRFCVVSYLMIISPASAKPSDRSERGTLSPLLPRGPTRSPRLHMSRSVRAIGFRALPLSSLLLEFPYTLRHIPFIAPIMCAIFGPFRSGTPYLQFRFPYGFVRSRVLCYFSRISSPLREFRGSDSTPFFPPPLSPNSASVCWCPVFFGPPGLPLNWWTPLSLFFPTPFFFGRGDFPLTVSRTCSLLFSNFFHFFGTRFLGTAFFFP